MLLAYPRKYEQRALKRAEYKHNLINIQATAEAVAAFSSEWLLRHRRERSKRAAS